MKKVVKKDVVETKLISIRDAVKVDAPLEKYFGCITEDFYDVIIFLDLCDGSFESHCLPYFVEKYSDINLIIDAEPEDLHDLVYEINESDIDEVKKILKKYVPIVSEIDRSVFEQEISKDNSMFMHAHDGFVLETTFRDDVLYSITNNIAGNIEFIDNPNFKSKSDFLAGLYLLKNKPLLKGDKLEIFKLDKKSFDKVKSKIVALWGKQRITPKEFTANFIANDQFKKMCFVVLVYLTYRKYRVHSFDQLINNENRVSNPLIDYIKNTMDQCFDPSISDDFTDLSYSVDLDNKEKDFVLSSERNARMKALEKVKLS